jgi:hypothetical protein
LENEQTLFSFHSPSAANLIFNIWLLSLAFCALDTAAMPECGACIGDAGTKREKKGFVLPF